MIVVLTVLWALCLIGFVEFLYWVFIQSYSLTRKYITDREIERIRRDFLDDPVEMTNDRGEIFWVGYHKN